LGSRRGPPPRQLAKLFRLKYLEGITDQHVLAEKLDVKLETVNRYDRRLKRKLVRKLGQVSPDRLCFVCPECLEARIVEDPETGERVCTACGYVEGRVESRGLPWDTTYAFTSNIAFGKSLGGTAPRRLFKVIAKAPNGTEDLPLRARQIQIVASAVDPPKVRNLLDYGSKLLREIGMDEDTEFNHLFADHYGRLLRKIGAFLQVSGMNVQGYMVARAALWHLLDVAGLHGKASLIREKFPFNTKTPQDRQNPKRSR